MVVLSYDKIMRDLKHRIRNEVYVDNIKSEPLSADDPYEQLSILASAPLTSSSVVLDTASQVLGLPPLRTSPTPASPPGTCTDQYPVYLQHKDNSGLYSQHKDNSGLYTQHKDNSSLYSQHKENFFLLEELNKLPTAPVSPESLRQAGQFSSPLAPSTDNLNNLKLRAKAKVSHATIVPYKKPNKTKSIGAIGQELHGSQGQGKQLCPLCNFEGKTRNPYRHLQDHLGKTSGVRSLHLIIVYWL